MYKIINWGKPRKNITKGKKTVRKIRYIVEVVGLKYRFDKFQKNKT